MKIEKNHFFLGIKETDGKDVAETVSLQFAHSASGENSYIVTLSDFETQLGLYKDAGTNYPPCIQDAVNSINAYDRV